VGDWRASQKRSVRTSALLAVFILPIALVVGTVWLVLS
jgi:hypothetical protein